MRSELLLLVKMNGGCLGIVQLMRVEAGFYVKG